MIQAAAARVIQHLKHHLNRQQTAPQIIQFPIWGEDRRTGKLSRLKMMTKEKYNQYGPRKLFGKLNQREQSVWGNAFF